MFGLPALPSAAGEGGAEVNNKNDGGPAFPTVKNWVTDDPSDRRSYSGVTVTEGGMLLRDWFAAQVALDSRIVEDFSECDDNDLLERFGTEEEKAEGFTTVFPGATVESRPRTIAGFNEHKGRQTFRNIELRMILEARGRARLRYNEADAMLQERSK